MGFFKKQERIEKMLEDYFAQCDACFELFEKAFETYFSQGLGKAFDEGVNATHKQESKADDLRRDIELTLYGKALLPESRGDILGLLETFDGLPNIAETVVFAVSSQQVAIPESLKEDFKRLVEVNLEAYRLARKAVDLLMNNPKVTLHATKEVDSKESASDHVERSLIRAAFNMDMDTGEKLLIKEIVLLVGEVSDRAQRVADRISLVAIKRQI